MNYGWHKLIESVVGSAALPFFFLAPGYAGCYATNLLGFRQRSQIEKMLWATVLSVPLALVLATHPGIKLSPVWTLHLFEAIFAMAVLLFFWDLRKQPAHAPSAWDRDATLGVLAVAAIFLYCLFAAMPIQIGHSLYESAAWQDWGIRTQLVNASLRGGNEPHNPMFAVAGVAPPLRYYYFWYVLCAQICLLTGIGARAALTASSAGAGVALLACIFLCLKHLRTGGGNLRKQCVAAVLTALVMGFDIIPAFLRAVLPYRRVYGDVQFWLRDRAPSWLHLLLWSPHHVAGLVCCIIGLLLVVKARQVSSRGAIAHAVFAGFCFAAAAGASTYVTGLFVVVCLLIAVDALLHREWKVLATLAAAGALSLVLAGPFLRSTLASPAGVSQEGASSPIEVKVRYHDDAHEYLQGIFQGKETLHRFVQISYHIPPPSRLQKLCTIPLIPLFFVLDFGFFLFILIYRARVDFADRGNPNRNRHILWMIFLGVAVPGCLLSSAALGANNDVGRHAGMCMRFIMLLWAAPLVADFLARRSQISGPNVRLTALQRCMVFAFCLGLATQVWQVAINRLEIPLAEAGKVPPFAVATRVPRIGFRFNQIRLAMDAATAATPANGVVQSNPLGRFQPVYLLYTGRQMAAVDDGCNTPFGGNPKLCVPVAISLIQLFGGTGPFYQGASYTQRKLFFYDAQKTTPAHFQQVCAENRLAAVVATYSDPVWHHPESWVWQLHPLFANATSRVFSCNASLSTVNFGPISPTFPLQ